MSAQREIEALQLVQRMAAGALTPQDLVRLQAGANAYLRAGGDLPFGRCISLPCNHAKHARALRDTHLLLAGAELAAGEEDGPSAWRISVLLETEIAEFENRSWPAWCKQGKPPDDADPLESHLFDAFMCAPLKGDGARNIPRTAMGLHRLFSVYEPP